MVGHRLAAVVLALLALACAAPPTRSPTPAVPAPPAILPGATYRAPIAAPVADGFRLPATPYGPGNRGIEYVTTPGAAVGAAGAGVVAFAGSVAGTGVVSIDHPDGLRTTYTHLRSVLVSVGDAVAAGAVVGASSDRLHFGVRLGPAYLDPLALITAGRGRVALVLDPDPRRRGEPVR